MERIYCPKIDDPEVRHILIDRNRLAGHGAKAAVKCSSWMVLFMQTPPRHLFVESTGRRGWIDFGMVGQAGRELRDLSEACPQRIVAFHGKTFCAITIFS